MNLVLTRSLVTEEIEALDGDCAAQCIMLVYARGEHKWNSDIFTGLCRVGKRVEIITTARPPLHGVLSVRL